MHRKIIAAFTVLVAVSLACTDSGTPTSEPPPAATETPTNIPTSTFTPSPIPDTPTPTPQVFVITVPADILWVDTGIDVNPRQTISIASTGDVNTWGGADISNSDADGQLPYICEREDCAMKENLSASGSPLYLSPQPADGFISPSTTGNTTTISENSK